jgi:transposase, IS30 family
MEEKNRTDVARLPKLRGYKHLDMALREEISIGLSLGLSQAWIAQQIGYSTATLSREIKRHTTGDIKYRAYWAQSQAKDASKRKGRRPKLVEGSPLWEAVMKHLQAGFSPQQTSQALKREFSGNHAMQVSHETIYQTLYVMPRNALKAVLVAEALRQHREKRRPQSKLIKPDGPKVRLVGGISIHERPADIEGRAVPGHWEGDLIKGEKNRSEVGVMLERQTRRVILAKLADARAVTVREAFETALCVYPSGLLKTLTYDQGSEMAQHATLSANTGIKVYFADAHSPWQKGAVENVNGLLRQYLPKGTNLSRHSQDELNAIAEKINNRPRECLGWDSPNEAWAKLLKSDVALNS